MVPCGKLGLYQQSDFTAISHLWIVKSSQTVGELVACDAVAIIVNGNDTLSNGQGSYYMTAYVLGGTPRTTYIGTGGNLEWTIDQPVGKSLKRHLIP